MRRLAPILIVIAACGKPATSPTPTFRHVPPASGIPVEASGITMPRGVTLEAVHGSYNLFEEHPVAARFSADGENLVSLAGDGTLRVWDVRSPALVRTIAPCFEQERDTGLDVLGSQAITGDEAGRICVRDLASGRVIRTWQAHSAPIRLLAMAGDSIVSYAYRPRSVVEASIGSIVEAEEAGGEARSWDVASGRKRAEVAIGASDAIGISGDGRVMLVGHRKDLRAIERVTGKTLWARDWSATCAKESYEPCFRALEVSADGSTAIVGTPFRLRTVELSGGATIGAFAFDGFWADRRPWSFVAVSRDGTRAASATDDGAFALFWDARRRLEQNHGTRVATEPHDAHGAAFSPDGRLLVMWGRGGMQLWDPVARRPVPRPSGHQRAVTRVAISADGARVLSSSNDGNDAIVWDEKTGREVARWPANGQGDLSPDGRIAVTFVHGGGAQGEIAEARDIDAGVVLWTATGRVRAGTARFSPDGRSVATQGDQDHEKLTLHDAKTGAPKWRVDKGTYDARPVLGFVANGSHVIALDEQRRLGRWRVADGKRLGTDGSELDARDFAAADDGSAYVTRGEGIWIHKAGAPGVLHADGGWYGLAFAPGGSILSSEYDGTIAFRDTSGAVIDKIDLRPSRDRATSLGVSADGSRLVVGTERGMVLVFALPAHVGVGRDGQELGP